MVDIPRGGGLVKEIVAAPRFVPQIGGLTFEYRVPEVNRRGVGVKPPEHHGPPRNPDRMDDTLTNLAAFKWARGLGN